MHTLVRPRTGVVGWLRADLLRCVDCIPLTRLGPWSPAYQVPCALGSPSPSLFSQASFNLFFSSFSSLSFSIADSIIAAIPILDLFSLSPLHAPEEVAPATKRVELGFSPQQVLLALDYKSLQQSMNFHYTVSRFLLCYFDFIL